jgi:hypothetical protein
MDGMGAPLAGVMWTLGQQSKLRGVYNGYANKSIRLFNIVWPYFLHHVAIVFVPLGHFFYPMRPVRRQGME